MIVVPYQPHHLAALEMQPAQAAVAHTIPEGYDTWLHEVGPAFTVLGPAGVLALCGLAEEWEGRAQCWAMLSVHVGRNMLALTRAVRAHFDAAPYRRIEAQTPEDFQEGHRWLRLLGFACEGPMANYYPDGRTAIRYARIKR